MHPPPPACTHACPVTPSLGVDSQRTVTHKGRRLARMHRALRRYRSLRLLSLASPRRSWAPSLARLSIATSCQADTTLGNLHRPRGARTSESVAVRLVQRGCGRQKRPHSKWHMVPKNPSQLASTRSHRPDTLRFINFSHSSEPPTLSRALRLQACLSIKPYLATALSPAFPNRLLKGTSRLRQ
jgi:hypothetical protein